MNIRNAIMVLAWALFAVPAGAECYHVLYTDDFSPTLQASFIQAKEYALHKNNPYLSPLHLFLSIAQHSTFNDCAKALNTNPQEIRLAIQNELATMPQMWGQPLVADRNLEQFLNECRRESVALGETTVSIGAALVAFTKTSFIPSAIKKILADKKITAESVTQWLTNQTTANPNQTVNISTNYPTLSKYAKDLTQQAEEGKLDPLIGRSEELERTVLILSRRTKNNPVLVGQPGVGKTAIIEGLAQRIVSKDVPECLQNKKILSLDLGSLVAGSQMRGEFEQRIKSIIKEVAQAGESIILFIDELHTLVGAGNVGGGMDASNLLKPALARGSLHCIGATTYAEYKKYIEKDAALERRFQKVTVDEPSEQDAQAILQGLKQLYEKYHGVSITDGAINTAVALGMRMIQDRYLPDKAIDLLDEAAAMAKIANPPKKEIDVEDIAHIVSLWLKIPVEKLTKDEAAKLLALEKELHKRVIGQHEAIEKVANVIRLHRAGMTEEDKPVGVFLFLGPTGVGKTETAKALADYLFNDERKMIRIDMSEYAEKHTIARLIGAPPGYIGHDDGGQLTEAVRRHPYSIVLFDELEKAHPDVFNTFLQIFDDGQLTDGQGRTVSFKNCIIIMTSNIGSHTILQADSITDDVRSTIEQQLYRYMRPELLNRIDEVVYFNRFTNEELKKIAWLHINKLKQKFEDKEINVKIDSKVIDHLLSISDTKHFGARPIKRAIQHHIMTPLTNAILKFSHKKNFIVKMKDKKIHILFPPKPEDFS